MHTKTKTPKTPRTPRTPKITARRLVCSAMMLIATGCEPSEDSPDPIVGSWQSSERVANEHNEMEIDPDLEGEATIYFFIGEEAYYADFDVVAKPDGGHDYELEFDCQGSCSDLDFEAECELDGDELECEGDGNWEEYEFSWELDSP